jgi:SpoVK/Ycf46/Vps4 family AAA+-type ATPase
MQQSNEHLKRLFQAFRDEDNVTFYQVADILISEELAANHHGLARDLKRALGESKATSTKTFNGSGTSNGLKALPKDRRSGDDLVTLQYSKVDQGKIILGDQTRARIERVLDEHRQYKILAKYGYAPKTKLLFWGLPGCGKTFTAQYIAYELGLPIGIVQLSALISSFLGDTASNLQRIFQLANTTPMVLLLDEVDAVGKSRDDSNDVGELKRVVNTLLQAMDMFHSSKSIIIAATNHQYLLDPALWRRFDDVLNFPAPGGTERERYIKSLLNGVHFEGSISNLAKNTSAMSYADIQRIVVEGVKTMILCGRETLLSKDITEQLRIYRDTVAASSFIKKLKESDE